VIVFLLSANLASKASQRGYSNILEIIFNAGNLKKIFIGYFIMYGNFSGILLNVIEWVVTNNILYTQIAYCDVWDPEFSAQKYRIITYDKKKQPTQHIFNLQWKEKINLVITSHQKLITFIKLGKEKEFFWRNQLNLYPLVLNMTPIQ
jgi:uncharacterized Fe-S radical SAM superfamily protein PflX